MNKINLNQLAKKEVEMKKNEMMTVRGGTAIKDDSDGCCCVCVNPGAPTASFAIEGNSNSAN